MAYNKIQITKEYPFDLKPGLSISMFDAGELELANSVKQQTDRRLNKWLQGLFSLFVSDKNRLNLNVEMRIKEITTDNDTEKQSLLDLENCANATREAEASGQYEWLKSSDE